MNTHEILHNLAMLAPWLIRVAAVALHNRAHGASHAALHHFVHVLQHNHYVPHQLVKLIDSKWFAELAMLVAMFAIGTVLDIGVERAAEPFEAHGEHAE